MNKNKGSHWNVHKILYLDNFVKKKQYSAKLFKVYFTLNGLFKETTLQYVQ